MADLPEETCQSLSSSSKSWGLGPTYIKVPHGEKKIYKNNRWFGRYLKYGLILVTVALLGFWITWLTIRTGEMLKMFYISEKPNRHG